MLGILKEERGCRLRPDDEVRFFPGNLEGKPLVDLQCLFLEGLVPFDRLIDVALNQAHFQGWLIGHLPFNRRHLDISVDQKSREDETRDDDLSIGEDLPFPLMKDRIKSRIDQKDNKRDAVDSRDICHLDQRKIEILRITQVRPGEPRQKKGTKIFQGDPEDRNEKNGLESEADLYESGQHRKRAREEGHVGYQKQKNEPAQNEGHISIGVDRNNDPVEDS